jgi:glycosyltransferase involved in cell wall biosynthesis
LIHMGFFYLGGGERTVLSQAIKLAERGIEADVYAPTASTDCYPDMASRVRLVEFMSFLPRRLALRNFVGMLTSSLASGILAKTFEDYDVVVAHGQPSYWLAYQIKRSLNIPYIAYIHQANRFLYPRGVDRQVGWGTNTEMQAFEILHKGNSLLRRIDRLSVTSSDLILTNSKWIRRQVSDCYGLDAEVCHPGVDAASFKATDRVGEASAEDAYILSTNRHYPQKRLDLAIRCVRELARRTTDVSCVITGGFTRYTKHLLELARQLGVEGRITFTGVVPSDELARIYRGASVYTYPSPEEDFGLGPIEAGASGVPSVVWDHAGPRETVVDRETGFRVKPYDFRLFVERHRELLDDADLRWKMGRRAHEHVLRNFTWERHAERLKAYIRKVAG